PIPAFAVSYGGPPKPWRRLAGGRTALRGLERPQNASSLSWRIPSAFSRGQAIHVGLTSIGIHQHHHNRSPKVPRLYGESLEQDRRHVVHSASRA
ncbi:MAG: hypothetical protein ACRD3C_02035, partial [Vicinamibacterales bacterium]